MDLYNWLIIYCHISHYLTKRIIFYVHIKYICLNSHMQSTLSLRKDQHFVLCPRTLTGKRWLMTWKKFERRIHLAIYFHGRNAEDNLHTVDYQFPAIPSASQWFPPKSIFPEVEVFLNNVKIDIFKPANFRTSKDKLTREERLALRSLKSSKILLEFKIKVLGSLSSVNKSIKIRILRQLCQNTQTW